MQQTNVVPSATAYKLLGMAMGQDSSGKNPGCKDSQVEADFASRKKAMDFSLSR